MLTLIGVRMHHEDPTSYLKCGVKYLNICIMSNAKWTCRYNMFFAGVGRDGGRMGGGVSG